MVSSIQFNKSYLFAHSEAVSSIPHTNSFISTQLMVSSIQFNKSHLFAHCEVVSNIAHTNSLIST